MVQFPAPDAFLLKWRGDSLKVVLRLDRPRKGRAALRTNIGRASVRRKEIIAETEQGITPLAKAWTDIPLAEVELGVFTAEIPLTEVGIFSAKACFFPEGSRVPEWPDGRNFHVKVEPFETRERNSIYCVFPRQFGSFREIVRRLPHIMDDMGFRIIQTLPPFPVPTSYAVMGKYGCPFAATDFLSVDPAMAEFDEKMTPLMQFKELIGAVHAKEGLMLLDLPANHTGWASTLQTHHPEWFNHESDGRFHSPGAWGVKWADLVELDYHNTELRAYMAEVFLFWCRIGVDGFRCDAGYMIPLQTWEYIVARVREEYPDTIFFLEGLGGEINTTDRLLSEANLDWAYSEIFQTYDRGQFERYLPDAINRAEKFGTLVHFAETHDNDRLAKGGETYARLRVQLAALLSWQGSWGISNGVEWFATEKIDVHDKNDLNWGAEHNMVSLIASLNHTLATNPTFKGECHLKLITRGDGNTVVVLRESDSGAKSLVLANLDCGRETTIDWDRSCFPYEGVVTLSPGEVRLLDDFSQVKTQIENRMIEFAPEAQFHIVMPRDIHRDVVVPGHRSLEIVAPSRFRIRLVEPTSNRTIRVERSINNRVVIEAPRYKGDGTRCRLLWIELTQYRDGIAYRSRSRLMISPDAEVARMKLALNGAEIRTNPDYRTILSNGAGACAQVRLGWGEIYSQYDALLSANPNPEVPSERLNLWTRTRIWLQREGYTREFNCRCTTEFLADPSGRWARWCFAVPCGMGKETAFEVTLTLVEGENVAKLSVVRVRTTDDVEDSVRLVFRPDIEYRSFHATTKAYMGAEDFFAKGGDSDFKFTLHGCTMHLEPRWTYNVGHPEEAARGQEGSGDVYSPGWISADLKIGERAVIVGSYRANKVRSSIVDPQPIVEANTLGEGLKRALDLYIVKRDDLKTVIAGYPWFLDWGRDTFIFMRGMIAAGRYAESLAILKAFAAFEENGTLPNIIYGKTAGNRDTTDAQLWFIRCVQELQAVGVDVGNLPNTCRSIVENYRKGTVNGIHVDSDSGLVWSPSHFTWMDTNYPACTPRVGYPIEIQALWVSALRYLGFEEEAKKVSASIQSLFKWEHGYRDCLSAPNCERAQDAVGEATIRPNQLFLITLGILKDESILRATEELLIPGGIRSLNAGHSLYRGVYEGDEDTSRKPAYHNGTVWAWPFPLYAEAMVMLHPEETSTALSLLSSAVENLNAGTIGHLSEIADGDSPHIQKGCSAQAWSDSELLRVWLKLGGR